MATDVGLGDSETPWLDVAPADTDTAASLMVTAPDGTSVPYTASGGMLTPIPGTSPVEYSQRWTTNSPVTYTAARRWVLHWTVTGTGEGTEDQEVWVSATPTPGGAAWSPARQHVADFVPWRTLTSAQASVLESEDTYQDTFTDDTRPPGTAVDRLITNAVARVSARVGVLDTSLYDAARTVAAMLAAAWVERGWPEDQDALQRASDLEKQAETLLGELVAANEAATGAPEPGLAVLPRWAFPAADCRYDDPRYW